MPLCTFASSGTLCPVSFDDCVLFLRVGLLCLQVLLKLLIDHGAEVAAKGADQMTCEEMLLARHHKVFPSGSIFGFDAHGASASRTGLSGDRIPRYASTQALTSPFPTPICFVRILWSTARRYRTIRKCQSLMPKCTTSRILQTHRVHGFGNTLPTRLIAAARCHRSLS